MGFNERTTLVKADKGLYIGFMLHSCEHKVFEKLRKYSKTATFSIFVNTTKYTNEISTV